MLSQVTKTLYISSTRYAGDEAALRRAGIGTVLNLSEFSLDVPAHIQVINAPFPDGAFLPGEKIDLLVGMIRSELMLEHRLLVTCESGVSRSPTIVLAYLVTTGMALPDAFRLLRTRHPVADPHPAMWDSLLAHFALPYSRMDVFLWTFE